MIGREALLHERSCLVPWIVRTGGDLQRFFSFYRAVAVLFRARVLQQFWTLEFEIDTP
jgi:hypothetical protein